MDIEKLQAAKKVYEERLQISQSTLAQLETALSEAERSVFKLRGAILAVEDLIEEERKTLNQQGPVD